MTESRLAAQTAAVDAAIASRRSLRAFLPTPVPREVVEDILRVASRAPSGTNTQPWQDHDFFGAHHIISEHIGTPEHEMPVCGMSLGHADPSAVENSLVTEREGPGGFVRFPT